MGGGGDIGVNGGNPKSIGVNGGGHKSEWGGGKHRSEWGGGIGVNGGGGSSKHRSEWGPPKSGVEGGGGLGNAPPALSSFWGQKGGKGSNLGLQGGGFGVWFSLKPNLLGLGPKGGRGGLEIRDGC